MSAKKKRPARRKRPISYDPSYLNYLRQQHTTWQQTEVFWEAAREFCTMNPRAAKIIEDSLVFEDPAVQDEFEFFLQRRTARRSGE